MLAWLRQNLLSRAHAQRRARCLLPAMSTMLQKSQNDGKEGCEVLPKRKEQVTALKNEIFDVLVIGGGAVGCGCALESATRGLKTALIEAEDFASGASSKSSKLIEGSNSYLHSAIQGADLRQIFMLQQVLNERATMLAIAPHLNRVQPMLMPIYSPLRLPLYWLGLKMYDAMAGMSNVRGSHFVSKEDTCEEFPMLRREGLHGSLVYYDVQLDDARMCLALAMTAAKHGATVANYVRLKKLMPTSDESNCRTAIVQDAITRECFTVSSRVVINATGAGTDAIRKMDDCKICPVAVPTMGTHIALPSYFGSPNCGLLFPSEQIADQALVMVPFENRMLVGSMDVVRQTSKCARGPTMPKADEVECLLHQTRQVLEDCVQLQPDNVLSAWTGIKPTIMCPTKDNKNDTEYVNVVSNFLLEVSDNQMITLAGGRWSTYRVMANDAIDMAIDTCQLEPQKTGSITKTLPLDGAENFCSMLPLDLVQDYDLPMDVAQHLTEAYGNNARQVLADCSDNGKERLLQGFPYIQAEVTYACQREYACHVIDVIARRLRVAFVDAAAAAKMLPHVLIIMSNELGWKGDEQRRQLQAAARFLTEQMGLGSIVKRPVGDACPKKCPQTAERSQVAQCSLKCVAQDTSEPEPCEQPSGASIVSRLGANMGMGDSAVCNTTMGSRGIATPLTGETFLMRVHASANVGSSAAGFSDSAKATVCDAISVPVSGSGSFATIGARPVPGSSSFQAIDLVPVTNAIAATMSAIKLANVSDAANKSAATILAECATTLAEMSKTVADSAKEPAKDSAKDSSTSKCGTSAAIAEKVASTQLPKSTEGSSQAANTATVPKNSAASSAQTKPKVSGSISNLCRVNAISTPTTVSDTEPKAKACATEPTTTLKSSEATASSSTTSKAASCTSSTDTASPTQKEKDKTIVPGSGNKDENFKKNPSGLETKENKS